MKNTAHFFSTLHPMTRRETAVGVGRKILKTQTWVDVQAFVHSSLAHLGWSAYAVEYFPLSLEWGQKTNYSPYGGWLSNNC